MTLTPRDFRAARIECGLSQADWAYALGYEPAKRIAAATHICGVEKGRRLLTPQVARLAEMFWRHGIPDGWAAAPDKQRGKEHDHR